MRSSLQTLEPRKIGGRSALEGAPVRLAGRDFCWLVGAGFIGEVRWLRVVVWGLTPTGAEVTGGWIRKTRIHSCHRSFRSGRRIVDEPTLSSGLAKPPPSSRNFFTTPFPRYQRGGCEIIPPEDSRRPGRFFPRRGRHGKEFADSVWLRPRPGVCRAWKMILAARAPPSPCCDEASQLRPVTGRRKLSP